jgi:hypothetical protein
MRLSRDAAEALAAAIVRDADVEEWRAQVEPVTQSILALVPPARVEELAVPIAARAWSDGFGELAETGLREIENEARASLERVETARRELEREPADNRLALLLVLCLGVRLASETRERRFALEAIEHELENAPDALRRRILVRRVGAALTPRARIPYLELRTAVTRANAAIAADPDPLASVDELARSLALALATRERRAAVRSAAEGMLELADDLPLVADELAALLSEPEPPAGDEDDLWVATVIAAVEADALGR